MDLDKYFPETIVKGIDYSLLTQREWHYFQIYSDIRKRFSELYPKPKHLQIDEEDTTFLAAERVCDPMVQMIFSHVFNPLPQVQDLTG